MTDIVVDSSALLAIVLGEDDANLMAATLFQHRGGLHLASATMLEALIVAEARHPENGARELRTLLEVLDPLVVPVTAELAELGFAAWRRFGKGRHPADLNYGDCFSYALAKILGAPLLFKGSDFAQTDLASVL